ncbi:Adenylate kinase isoenzyme 1, partial [Quaeritorhiza haematococci]
MSALSLLRTAAATSPRTLHHHVERLAPIATQRIVVSSSPSASPTSTSSPTPTPSLSPPSSTGSTSDGFLSPTSATTRTRTRSSSSASATPPHSPLLASQRRTSSPSPSTPRTPTTSSSRKTPLILILGGPGVGKGSQCALLSQEFGYIHLSTGELLRREVSQGTALGAVVGPIMERGDLVPSKIVAQVLSKAIETSTNPSPTTPGSSSKSVKGVIVDGYPRSVEQAVEFERIVGRPDLVLNFTAPPSTLRSRLLARSRMHIRQDDNPVTIMHRIEMFEKEGDGVVEYFRKGSETTVVDVEAVGGVEEVYGRARERVWEVVVMEESLNNVEEGRVRRTRKMTPPRIVVGEESREEREEAPPSSPSSSAWTLTWNGLMERVSFMKWASA